MKNNKTDETKGPKLTKWLSISFDSSKTFFVIISEIENEQGDTFAIYYFIDRLRD